MTEIRDIFNSNELILLRGLLIGEIQRSKESYSGQYVKLYEKINYLAGFPSPEIL